MDLIIRLRLAVALFVSVVVIGIAGYMFIGGWSFTDAIYMTIITITTVGYKEVHPLNVIEEYFTIFLMMAGIGTAFYLLILVAEFLIEGHLSGMLAERRVENKIKTLEGHYILCGYGKVGENVANEFITSNVPFVIIESSAERVLECRELGMLCIEGDASSDEVLLAAGIERARGLVTAVDNDADNLFVTLSARVMNPDINIVARGILEESREKLIRAGANRVVTPSIIGGKRMASIMLRPLVSDYLDVVTFGEGLQLRLEELIVKTNSPAKGLSLGGIDIRKHTGALILAIRRKEGEFNTNPSADTVIEEGDNLVVLGTHDQLDGVKDHI